MSRTLKFLIFIYFVLFLSTGAALVLVVNAEETSASWILLLARNHGIVFVWHLACWMTLGMFSNYYWDLFNLGKGMESLQVERIILPLLVSPIVFYPTYNLWLSSSSQSYILFEVIAFQSGFFWQALFTKAKPIDQATAIPWSVNNSGGTRGAASKSAPPASQEYSR